MKRPLSICVITGSRADYSYLYTPMKCIQASDKLRFQLVVTGMHLSQRFGHTADYIEADGFRADAQVQMLSEANDAAGVITSIGEATIQFAQVFKNLQPDMLLVLGDRFETLAAVQAALVAQIPVAHIGGGDVTQGAFDDAIRHSITKMSHLHFVTNEQSKRRVMQMGENPAFVHLTGSPAIDLIKKTQIDDKTKLLTSLGISDDYQQVALLTYHPETLSHLSIEVATDAVISSLSSLKDTAIIITGANADTGGQFVNNALQTFAAENDHCFFFMSLGKDRFYNCLHHCDVFIGNSSSGLYEASSFQTPSVNIGERQKGRICAPSVISCATETSAIVEAMQKALVLDCQNTINPYGQGDASEKIVEIMSAIEKPKSLLQKTFYDYEPS
jgi:UDP-hydrolysing UDP-N-acetyl-D-glucosamine 2-epimerase